MQYSHKGVRTQLKNSTTPMPRSAYFYEQRSSRFIIRNTDSEQILYNMQIRGEKKGKNQLSQTNSFHTKHHPQSREKILQPFHKQTRVHLLEMQMQAQVLSRLSHN